VSATDRGLAYGDGVFRTFIAHHGVAQHWSMQYAKLAADCTRLGITAPAASTLEAEIRQVCTSEPECVVKIVVTSAEAERGYRRGGGVPTRIIMTAAVPKHAAEYRQSGVRVRTCHLRLAHQPALAGIKHLNRLENVLARAEWDDAQIAEGILLDADEHAIGGTMTNLFVVTQNRLATPHLDRCGVAGVTRDRIIAAATRNDIACEVRAVTMKELRRADELFLVNSVVGIWPVQSLDGNPMPVGPVTKRLQRCLDEETDAQVA
jgi:4-amino-4-deoxychorismate lyase